MEKGGKYNRLLMETIIRYSTCHYFVHFSQENVEGVQTHYGDTRKKANRKLETAGGRDFCKASLQRAVDTRRKLGARCVREAG